MLFYPGTEAGIKGPIAMRNEHWKLLARNAPDQKPELYNLTTDIGEASDVAAKHPEIVLQLQEKLDAWESELVAPLWGPGSPGFVETNKRRK